MSDIIFDILKTSIYISIPIIVIALSKDKILSKYTHKSNYMICILIILRMLFISNIEVYLPFEIPINQQETILKSIEYISYENKNSLDYTKLLFMLWMFGCLYNIFINTYKQVMFYEKIRNISHEVVEDNILNIFEEVKKELNIKVNIKILKVDGLSSPAVIKILNSKIIIPNKEYNQNQLKWIFRHELIHLKRKDNFIKLLLMIGHSIHWFNPLIKIFKIYFDEQCEFSCDEKVIQNVEISDIKDYALVLVNSLRYKNTLKSTMMYSQFNTNQNNLIKRRVEGMLNFKKYKNGKSIVLALCSISVFSILSFNIVNNQNQVYANQSPTNKESNTKRKPITDEELRENLKNINYDEVEELMEFYPDRKFDELTQEEIDYALDFLFTGKCKKVNIGSDVTYSINTEALNKDNKN